MPACQTDFGCEISDVAPSHRANFIVTSYLHVRLSKSARTVAEVRRKILGRAGLLKDVDLLLELDSIYQEFERYLKQQQRERIEAERSMRNNRYGR